MSQVTEMVVIIRPSFMKFCDDGCRAAAFNHILYWIAHKAKDEPQEKIQSADISWYATSEEIAEGMANAWSSQKVRPEVNKLVEMGLIGRRSNPQWKVDRTKFFFFGPEQCATFLDLCKKHSICLFGLGLSKEVLRLLACCAKANDKVIQCSCGQHDKQIINMSDGTIYLSDGKTNISLANDKYVRAITKVSTKDTTKVTTKDKKIAALPATETSASDDAQSPTLFETNLPREEEKKSRGKKEQPDLSEEEQAYEKRWRHWRDYIYARRGGPLRQAGLVINETDCLKKLVKEFTDEQIAAIDQYIATEVWPHKNNPAKIGGKILLDESLPAWQKIKDKIQPKLALVGGQDRPNAVSGIDEKAADAVIERMKQRALQKQGKGA